MQSFEFVSPFAQPISLAVNSRGEAVLPRPTPTTALRDVDVTIGPADIRATGDEGWLVAGAVGLGVLGLFAAAAKDLRSRRR